MRLELSMEKTLRLKIAEKALEALSTPIQGQTIFEWKS
ncbi:hypothetical protein H0A61_02006 [Koleobacter methoxysyntrophicus]|uniref:Uncharacterized protein n=1 Tax=Koleobacter methoxysyntrophicus TaxID=2751313 RepID=A0A8A0RQ34_9FIRM|nr:hypothetical protein H0A61_02006 [Koleobacter methoxysyntrophicus]